MVFGVGANWWTIKVCAAIELFYSGFLSFDKLFEFLGKNFSDCGSSGQASITTEDQIVFNFRASKKANNGTDVNSGQIPAILYRVINQDFKESIINSDIDPVHKVSQQFANSVTKDCFQSLITLLKWSWGTFKLTLNELKDKVEAIVIVKLLRNLVVCTQTYIYLISFAQFFRKTSHNR